MSNGVGVGGKHGLKHQKFPRSKLINPGLNPPFHTNWSTKINAAGIPVAPFTVAIPACRPEVNHIHLL